MKLFLCGGGSGKKTEKSLKVFSSVIDRNKPLLYIPLAMDESRYPSCLEWIKSEMQPINVVNIEMVTSKEDLYRKNLNDYCAIYIGGGNTFKLLKDIKDGGSFEKIKKYIENDGVIFGGSAGAIIFGKDILSCKTQDPNNVNLEDTKGFNVLNGLSLLCHLSRNDGVKFNRNKNSDYLLEYSKKNKTIYLPDEDVIFIDDDKMTIIGEEDFRFYSNGDFKIIKSSSLNEII